MKTYKKLITAVLALGAFVCINAMEQPKEIVGFVGGVPIMQKNVPRYFNRYSKIKSPVSPKAAKENVYDSSSLVSQMPPPLPSMVDMEHLVISTPGAGWRTMGEIEIYDEIAPIATDNVYTGPQRLHNAVREENIKLCRYLLDEKADVNAHNDVGAGETPLHWAAENNNVALCQLLVKIKANVNAVALSEHQTRFYCMSPFIIILEKINENPCDLKKYSCDKHALALSNFFIAFGAQISRDLSHMRFHEIAQDLLRISEHDYRTYVQEYYKNIFHVVPVTPLASIALEYALPITFKEFVDCNQAKNSKDYDDTLEQFLAYQKKS